MGGIGEMASNRIVCRHSQRNYASEYLLFNVWYLGSGAAGGPTKIIEICFLGTPLSILRAEATLFRLRTLPSEDLGTIISRRNSHRVGQHG